MLTALINFAHDFDNYISYNIEINVIGSAYIVDRSSDI
jgi:hypothetical protein